MRGQPMHRRIPLFLLCAAVLALVACSKETAQRSAAAPAEEPKPIAGEPPFQPDAVAEAKSRPPAKLDLEFPGFNPRRGRILFTTKGCVICHQVNGVGGAVAPALDAPPGDIKLNPLDFAGRMWRGAAAMTALQETELGYVIDLDGKDIADLSAFAASAEEQSLMTLESVPEPLRDWFIDASYWEEGEWSEYRARGGRIPDIEKPQ